MRNILARLALVVRPLYLAVGERKGNIAMGVRTALPKTELPYQIRRRLTDWEKDAGMLPQLATFASFTIAAEVWPRIVESNPRERLTLQHGARVIYIHEPDH